MNLTAEQKHIRWLAHQWWNFDLQPPEKYRQQVLEYLRDHPDEFKGLTPQ